jgi:hypothetical protein
MNEAVAKLVDDLVWRIRRGTAKYRPSDKEIASWAPFTVHGAVPILVSFVLPAFAAFSNLSEDAAIAIWLASIPLLYWLRGVINFRCKLGAYKRLLLNNERFMLVEYSKYLKRQISRVRDEPVLGGDAEVRRLKELQERFNAMLQQGVSKDNKAMRSNLADEADLAEAMLETYNTGAKDELAALDARLPADLRERIADLDRESASTSGRKVAQ